jgi:hypothetical protein
MEYLPQLVLLDSLLIPQKVTIVTDKHTIYIMGSLIDYLIFKGSFRWLLMSLILPIWY